MKNGWPVKQVAEIAQRSLGKMLDKAKNKGTPRPYLRNVNVRWFSFDLSDLLEMRFLDEESGKFTAVKGDVLICEGGYPGRAAIWEEDYPIHFQKAIHRVRFHEPDRNKWFLYYLHYQEITGQLRQHYTGTGIQHFTGEALARLRIPLPPLPEQRRIVGILDEAFAGIATAKANAEKNLQNARGVFESYLQDVFTQRGEGWVDTTLSEMCRFKNGDRGKNYPNREEYVDSGIPWINTGHIQANGTLSQSEMNYITRKKYDSLRSGKIQAGDLVYCLRGATLGKTALVEPLTIGAVASSLVIIRPSNKLKVRFLYYFLISSIGQSHITTYRNGAAQPNLGAKSVAKYPISFPTLAEQEDIVKGISGLAAETQRLESIYQQKLAALDELKKSLLHRAFSGEL
ncbi:MAG: restriction endonuclease subunit S [Planctomycetaceae bacterium]